MFCPCLPPVLLSYQRDFNWSVQVAISEKCMQTLLQLLSSINLLWEIPCSYHWIACMFIERSFWRAVALRLNKIWKKVKSIYWKKKRKRQLSMIHKAVLVSTYTVSTLIHGYFKLFKCCAKIFIYCICTHYIVKYPFI